MRLEGAVFSTIICDRHSRLTFFKDFNDLVIAVPTPFNIWLFFPCLSIYHWFYFWGILPPYQ